MEQHFPKFPKTGLPHEVYPNFRNSQVPGSFLSIQLAAGKSRIFGGMVRISEIQQFAEFLGTFREISVPFESFSWMESALYQLIKYICICSINCQPGSYFKAPLNNLVPRRG